MKIFIIILTVLSLISCNKNKVNYVYKYSYHSKQDFEYAKQTGHSVMWSTQFDVERNDDKPYDSSKLEAMRLKHDNSKRDEGIEPFNSKYELDNIDSDDAW